ncbi:RNA polymerase, sigma-24 subunit, ECF subfamily [Methylobacterium sp. 4-46]|uniref:sigma-70 family RNA polymerase sigma factor n=1 Tax=unclassified Methylobacterium TaxID=2615210 RepID=UPI000152C4D2|nr:MULTISPECIES: sigma-70 family RNA polymerase sigma factor [Methylobacterium]ACA15304.1 RNA polymerase, sigma-24 subunit, ECF subfamily [Methylobacterium sp. 4-46]WFT81030.1 sigma-70 family RNA polymerase sigma factor [Methylobacterium nodulans]
MAFDHDTPTGRDRAAAVPGEGRPLLPRSVHAHLGRQLQAVYGALLAERQPQLLLDLVARLEVALDGQPASRFREDLLEALPALRAFAVSLTANVVQADDLVQETLLRAWQNQDRFAPGTNLKAWLFTILRNQFYTVARKRRREVEDADGEQAARMVALPDQEDGIELRDVWMRLSQLPTPQREALLLVGAQGLTYEAAAALMGCQVGTVKSRVNRARAALAQALGYEGGRSGRSAAL